MKTKIISILLLSSGLALAEQADTPKMWYEEGRLFDGRENLEESGISPFLYFDSIYAGNVDGGVRTDDQFTAQVYAGADLDLEKLLGWNATTLKISMVNRQGNGIAGDVGGIYDPMCINGGPAGQVAWLYQLWIETMIGEDVAVKFGRTSMDEDFANDDLYRYSLSTAINGPIRSMMLDSPQIYSFPLGLWGGRVKYTLDEEHQFQLGFYQINDSIWSDYVKGTDWSWRSDDGVTIMAQYDWTPEIFERPARFYFGIADSIYEYDDFDGGDTSNLLRFYGHGAVEVIEGLKLFLFGAYTTQDETASVPLQLSGGANWKGLFPGRVDDHTMAFITYAGLSDDYNDARGVDTDQEMVFELGHRFQIIPSFYIQPSVQYVSTPAANADADDALVLGAWVGAAF